MKQIPSDKYTIAWFKLAECVARGEKERALGVYRLLSHSFNDDAYRIQLEGDILFSFDDVSQALVKYEQVVEIYKKNNRFLEAATSYEHMLGIDSTNHTYFVDIISLYQELKLADKALHYECQYIRLLLDQGHVIAASTALKKSDERGNLSTLALLHERLARELVKKEFSLEHMACYHIKKAVQGLVLYYDYHALQRLLLYLEQYQEEYYLIALEESEKDL